MYSFVPARVGVRCVLSSMRTISGTASLSRFASAAAIGNGVSLQLTNSVSLRALSTLSFADDKQTRHQSLPSGLAAGMLVAAVLAATEQNSAGDCCDSLRAKCCGIAGVVGGESTEAR